MTRKDWASKDALIAEVADVPENWLRAFAVRHPLDCRKFARTRNGSMMYRVEAVLKAIEDGEGMPNEGILARDENGEAVYDGEAPGKPAACAAGTGQGGVGAQGKPAACAAGTGQGAPQGAHGQDVRLAPRAQGKGVAA